jgi:pimeloyl-ACP methyl ester carboxylesterase
LAEIDTMALLKSIREQYAVDSDRIYLMGHSMGGAGTYYLGGKYNDIWAGLAPISGAGGIADGAAERYKSLPTLIMHGAKDSIVSPATSRRAVAALQAVGAPLIYLEFPDKDHEFWIRRGAPQMEKVFLFFSLISKRTTVLPPRYRAFERPAVLVSEPKLFTEPKDGLPTVARSRSMGAEVGGPDWRGALRIIGPVARVRGYGG